MSIVIRIKTPVKIGLHEVIGKLFDEGFHPSVEATEPTLFYLPEISTRLIEFGEEEDGYYARQVGMACQEDYKAFISTIKILQELTNGIVINEEEEEINPTKLFTDEWIKKTMKSDFSSIKALMLSDQKIELAIFGPIRMYYFGSNVLKQLTDYSTNEEEQHQYIYELIRKSQYGLPKADYPDVMEMSKRDENEARSKTILLLSNSRDILVAGNLDYLIINQDDVEVGAENMILIKREDLHKIAPEKWWLFDDRQYFAPRISDAEWNDFVHKSQPFRLTLDEL